MRMSSRTSFHGVTVAVAEESGDYSWLTFGDENEQPLAIFMPYAKAVALAEVFNAKEDDQ